MTDGKLSVADGAVGLVYFISSVLQQSMFLLPFWSIIFVDGYFSFLLFVVFLM